MKRINYFVVTFIAIVAIMTSCEKQNVMPTIEEGVVTKITIGATTANDDNPESKTSINDLDFTWVTGDVLKVYAKSVAGDGTPKEFTLKETDNGQSKGAFEGELALTPGSPEHVYAVYSAASSKFKKEEGSDNVIFEFWLPDAQEQKHDEHGTIDPTSLGAYANMYGRSAQTIDVVNNITPMYMSQGMAIIDFNLSDVPSNTKIHSLTLKTSEYEFPIRATVDLDADISSAVVGLVSSTYGAKPARVDLKTGASSTSGVVVTDGNLKIRLAIYPLTVPENATWYVELNTSDQASATATTTRMYTRKFTALKEYKAGHRYPAPLSFNDFKKLGAVIDASDWAILSHSGNYGAVSQYGPLLMFNNNKDNFWATNDVDYPYISDGGVVFAEINLKKQYMLTGVRLGQRNHSTPHVKVKKFQVKYKENSGDAWQTVGPFEVGDAAYVIYNVLFDTPIQAGFLYLDILEHHHPLDETETPKGGLSIAIFDAFGSSVN